MNHGIVLRANGAMATWTWGDLTCRNPLEFDAQQGDQLLDLSHISEDEQLTFIALVRRKQGAARDRLLASVPRVNIPDAPPPPDGHVTCLQPGYRRICHRPTLEWHQQELVARWEANQRLTAGESIQDVVDAVFTHLSQGQPRRARMGDALPTEKGHARFSLPPMVKLLERRTMTGVETIREFPFHITVAEF
jgi:hypothetical protein